MNAITRRSDSAPVPMDEDRLIDVMRSSLYPGAKPESVVLVLGYCRARGLDPLRKPVHIVPMYVKPAGQKSGGSMQDVVMPGIALYRIEAARTGEYAGKTEPVFGPDVTKTWKTTDYNGNGKTVGVTYPVWCSITVCRVVAGKQCEFTAKEYWLENYATAGRDSDAPNAMWQKRPYGQLAKCAEAQALRMAFPEATGGEPTAEEMEGKTGEPRQVESVQVPPATRAPVSGGLVEHVQGSPAVETLPIIAPDGKMVPIPKRSWLKAVTRAVTGLQDADAVSEWRQAMGPHLGSIAAAGDEELVALAEEAIGQRLDSFSDRGDAYEPETQS